MIIKRTIAKRIYFEVKYVLLNRVNLNIKFLGSKIIINLYHILRSLESAVTIYSFESTDWRGTQLLRPQTASELQVSPKSTSSAQSILFLFTTQWWFMNWLLLKIRAIETIQTRTLELSLPKNHHSENKYTTFCN